MDRRVAGEGVRTDGTPVDQALEPFEGAPRERRRTGRRSRRGSFVAAGRRDQIMMRACALSLLAAAAALALAGCGERPQVVNYKQGKYQGKPDTPAYANAPFNGNRQQYENTINTRTQGQNEYVRLRD